MNFLYWNCRGTGNDRFCSIVNYLRRSCKVDVMTITKPKVCGVVGDKIVEKLGFNASFRVEAHWRYEGIWVLWNKNKMKLDIVNSSRNFIHPIMDEGRGIGWVFTTVYVNPNEVLRKKSFEKNKQMVDGVFVP